jgi:GDP-4-dehydro-6-deoxy-D-mannose reductase
VRALVTGIAGFAGSHLAEHLVQCPGVEVHGVVAPGHPYANLRHLSPAEAWSAGNDTAGRLLLHAADLMDAAVLARVVADVCPDAIYHLAARASVGGSWHDPQGTLVDNTIMQLNLLQAATEWAPEARILVVGSSDEYGRIAPEDLPVSEETPLRPLSPYAVSKVTQDYLGLQYHLSRGLHVVRVRPFNHVGPRQQTGFVAPDLACQIARIEAGLAEPVLRVGNLDARRDFTDVRDVVRAYRLVLEQGAPGEVYNVGAGRSWAVREVLDTLVGLAGVPIRVEPDPARMRPSDIPDIVCDYRRLRDRTGWEPERPISHALVDVLADWRARVNVAAPQQVPTDQFTSPPTGKERR